MKVTKLHAHFLISLGNYNNERIGFSIDVDDNDNLDDIVSILRQKAINIVGSTADQYYSKLRHLKNDCSKLEKKLEFLRKEWDATATFLKTQGLNPDAPSMPQFRNLLTAVTVESEVVTYDTDDDNYDEDDEGLSNF